MKLPKQNKIKKKKKERKENTKTKTTTKRKTKQKIKKKKKGKKGWGDGSAIKSADSSSKGPEFKSQQPHGGSQPSVTKSDALFWSV